MTQRMRWSQWILLGLLFTGTAVAQMAAGPKFVVREEKAPESAVIKGFVRVFSHNSITVEERNHPYALKTFSLPASLADKYRERHLDYGDHVKVLYSLQGSQAIAIHARWRKGS